MAPRSLGAGEKNETLRMGHPLTIAEFFAKSAQLLLQD